MEVVLPSGEIVITNQNSYPDLFWAMRGGGGSTFGIVTKMTYKAHPFESLDGIRITITPGSSGQEGYIKAMAYFMAKMTDFVDFGMTGYPIMFSHRYDSLFTAPGKKRDQINEFISPVLDKLRALGVTVTTLDSLSSVMALAIANGTVPHAGTGLRKSNSVMGTRLISRSACKDIPRWERVLKVFFDEGYITEPFPVLGGAVSKNAKLNVSLNPAWRKAVIHFSILDKNSDQYTQVEGIQRSYAKMQERHIPLLDAMSVNSAAYLNEASYLEPNCKKTFWGENYGRLLEVKRKYDPNNTLWCRPCVGSDVFMLGEDSKLYRA